LRNGGMARKIVIRAPNWLGDAVMALPAMAAVRAKYPDAQLAIAAISSVAPVFQEDTPAAPGTVLAISNPRREAALLSAGEFDLAVLLPNSFRSAWVARRARIPERWGYARNLRGALLTRAVAPPRRRLHQCAYYGELVRALDMPPPEMLPWIRPRARSRGRAEEVLARERVPEDAVLVGMAPGAAYGHAKRWPPSRAAELVTRLVRDRGAVCVLVGAAGDRDAGREIESSLPAGVRAVNLIGRTDLGVLIGLLARCRAFVSNDSGAMHLAAAAGVPVVAMFGPTDERVTAPLGDHDVLIHQVFCRPCMLRDCPIDHRCMKGISVDAAFAAVMKHLHGARPERSGP
jgi:heptosyltransferase-2